jgi:acid-sensing ion channel, other
LVTSYFLENSNLAILNFYFVGDMNDLFETDKKWALTFDLTLQSKVFVLSFEENIGYDFRPQMVWDINYAADLLITMKMTYTTDDARQLSIG